MIMEYLQSMGEEQTAFSSIVAIILTLLILISLWKIFKKAGRAGFWAIIPYANLWVYFKVATRNHILWFILAIIPFTSWIAGIAGCFGLAKTFGKGFFYGLFLLFFPYIALPILAFGKSEYQGF